MMPGRLMWGTENDAAVSVDPAVVADLEDDGFAMLAHGQTGTPGTGNGPDMNWPVLPATRVIYLTVDGGDTHPIAVTGAAIESNPDVLAAIEEQLGPDADVRPDAPAEPAGDETPVAR